MQLRPFVPLQTPSLKSLNSLTSLQVLQLPQLPPSTPSLKSLNSLPQLPVSSPSTPSTPSLNFLSQVPHACAEHVCLEAVARKFIFFAWPHMVCLTQPMEMSNHCNNTIATAHNVTHNNMACMADMLFFLRRSWIVSFKVDNGKLWLRMTLSLE